MPEDIEKNAREAWYDQQIRDYESMIKKIEHSIKDMKNHLAQLKQVKLLKDNK